MLARYAWDTPPDHILTHPAASSLPHHCGLPRTLCAPPKHPTTFAVHPPGTCTSSSTTAQPCTAAATNQPEPANPGPTMFLSKLLGFGPPPKPRALVEAEGCFTKEELQAIHQQLAVAADTPRNEPVVLTPQQLWGCCRQPAFPALLCSCWCAAVRRQLPNAEGSLTADAVVVTKARCERLDSSSSQDFAFLVLSASCPRNDGVSRAALKELLLEVLQLAMAQQQLKGGDPYATADALATGAVSCDSSGDTLTRDSYGKWCKLVPAVHTLLTSLLAGVGLDPRESPSMPPGAAGFSSPSQQQQQQQSKLVSSVPRPLGGGWQCPQLGWGLCSPSDGLLQPEWMWLLSAGLPPDQRQEWRLLFNSYKHGMSFNTFMGRVGPEAAPTLLLIKDKGGHLFGGVAGTPWRKTGTFYGDHSSWVFGLLPAMLTYPASGINTNLQWCGQGFSQLPNGIGFGGQVGNYGVWVDASFENGMSRPVATYASPCLASAQTFEVEAVECWLLKPPEEEPEPAAGRKGGSSSSSLGGKGGSASVLHKAKEDQKLLELAGVAKNYSAAAGEEPLEG